MMAELTTAMRHNLPVKVMILKNNSLAEVRFEQADQGYKPFGIELGPIDFVAVAKACGVAGFRVETSADLRPAIEAALRDPGPAVIEVVVDPNERPAMPDKRPSCQSSAMRACCSIRAHRPLRHTAKRSDHIFRFLLINPNAEALLADIARP
jgi:thiamine pyrophosphate-dependent acetolactate synthase large subunit-like protein